MQLDIYSTGNTGDLPLTVARKMTLSTLLEVFGHILHSFTRGVSEHYNPDEPEFTFESFGYSPLESTGREWYCHPVDELIYQEYSDREATSLNYLTSTSLNITVTNASSLAEENEETQAHPQERNKEIAWKQLRPSALCTICKSMYIGALISIATAISMGTIYMMVTYLSFKTSHVCQYYPVNSTSIEIQWVRSMTDIISCSFLYIWFFAILLLVFRPFQLMGIKRTLLMICFLTYSLDTIYRVALQALGISHSRLSNVQKLPLRACILTNQCLQTYVLTNYFCTSSRQKLTMFVQMVVPSFLCLLPFVLVDTLIYPAYNQANEDGKLLIAVFAPLIGVIVKVTCRICVQRLYNIVYPGYSYICLSAFYFGSAIFFRILQADLGSLEAIVILGTIHGAAEVVERSTIVLIDHFCYVIWRRAPAPWGSFRTPGRERLTADIAIMSMLYESTAIVAVNGYLYLYQFIFVGKYPLDKLLRSFSIHTAVPLAIEWVFNSVSLAIESRYQNMAVMAVWRRRWKRHILVAVVNAVPVCLWSSSNLLDILHGRFSETSTQLCKMPFT